MNDPSLKQPVPSASSMDVASRRRSSSDMKAQIPGPRLIDEQVYCTTVLQLPAAQTEDEVDERIHQEAQHLGLLASQVAADLQGMASFLSATTIGSESVKQGSVLSQSTAPTSCSSSEHRPMTQSSTRSGNLGQTSQTQSIMSDTQRKRSSGFRNGLRNRMAGFKRRKSPTSLSSIPSDIIKSSDVDDKISMNSGMKSPTSVKSGKSSSWSSPISAAKSSYESAPPIDQEAISRSLECSTILELQKSQAEEKTRFLDFERYLLAELRIQRDKLKDNKRGVQSEIVESRQSKIEKAVEELEARQLEDELKMVTEHEQERRMAMTRLRHMEAYCQSTLTPPATPVDATHGRLSLDAIGPERKVTDKDYHNLAQQYRERDAMETLHASKINVLRGKQKKAVENFLRKKEREVETLERDQLKELEQIDNDFASQEDNLRSALQAKRGRLELRWQTRLLIERTKMEKSTGLRYGPLPEITTIVETAVVS